MGQRGRSRRVRDRLHDHESSTGPALQAAQWWASQTSTADAVAKVWMDDRHTVSPQRARKHHPLAEQRDELTSRWNEATGAKHADQDCSKACSMTLKSTLTENSFCLKFARGSHTGIGATISQRQGPARVQPHCLKPPDCLRERRT